MLAPATTLLVACLSACSGASKVTEKSDTGTVTEKPDTGGGTGGGFSCGSSSCNATTEYCSENDAPHMCGELDDGGSPPIYYTCVAIPSQCASLSDRPRDMCNCISDMNDGNDGGVGDAGNDFKLMDGDQCTVREAWPCE